MDQQDICCNGILKVVATFEGCLTGCTLTLLDNAISTVGKCTSVPLTASDYTSLVYGAQTVTTTASSSRQSVSTGATKAWTVTASDSNTPGHFIVNSGYLCVDGNSRYRHHRNQQHQLLALVAGVIAGLALV
ncbi:hypothetical protein SUNI508_07218 [Seiridium unicorne]|uniref:Uncharacterized protein n=1 Tax=Seiridium unicorne TaxID=138068 RepID=A0ABR2UYQ4_9PEZI